jgi:hypothetical protein
MKEIMKNLYCLLICVSLCLCINANDFLTIYNNNLAHYRTEIELDLKRGTHFYSFERIPTNIVAESVIFIPRDRNISLWSQNYEYDLANSQKTIQKYIDKNVRITTDAEAYAGILIFFDGASYGIQNPTTKELSIINASKVNNVLLSEMPADFYTRPTLRWELNSPRDGRFRANLSFLTRGIEWRATYNVVLNKNDFDLNSWVTINNRSGKNYENVKLKLVAGNVQTQINDMSPRATTASGLTLRGGPEPPAFSEREFSDFRLYTLDKLATIENNQEKQLSLYPLKKVKYQRKYSYTVGGNATDVFISFKNTSGDGLGLPLPAGNINFYETDTTDNTQQFVGVGRINHTSQNQDVSIRIGTAFDILATHRIVSAESSNRVSTTVYEVNLFNNKSESVNIEVVRNTQRHGNVEILNPSVTFVRENAFTHKATVRVTAGGTTQITFTERISN